MEDFDLDFDAEFIAPYYGGLMGFNFMRKEIIADPHAFLDSVCSLKSKLSNKEIVSLLNHNWRPSKVGAWIIGLAQIKELEKNLIEYLNNRSIHCEHVIISLVMFNSKNGNSAIEKFIYDQLNLILNEFLNKNAYQAIENFGGNSINWAFEALEYLDQINQSHVFQDVIHSDKWAKVKVMIDELILKQPNRDEFFRSLVELDQPKYIFSDAMSIIKKTIIKGHVN